MMSVDVVLPVYNEAHVLERSVRTLHLFLTDHLAHEWRILIADNGSHDGTFEIAQLLAAELKEVEAQHIPEAGRGRALSRTWLGSPADVLAYMDIDLSTDLEAFPRLVSVVADQGFDVAAGTRLGAGSETTRSPGRELLSRRFVLLINLLFATRLRDTQCGFKAIRREAAEKLLPLVRDTGWFWDTELLLLAASRRMARVLRAGALGGGPGQPRQGRLDGVARPQGAGANACLRLTASPEAPWREAAPCGD